MCFLLKSTCKLLTYFSYSTNKQTNQQTVKYCCVMLMCLFSQTHHKNYSLMKGFALKQTRQTKLERNNRKPVMFKQ